MSADQILDLVMWSPEATPFTDAQVGQAYLASRSGGEHYLFVEMTLEERERFDVLLQEIAFANAASEILFANYGGAVMEVD